MPPLVPARASSNLLSTSSQQHTHWQRRWPPQVQLPANRQQSELPPLCLPNNQVREAQHDDDAVRWYVIVSTCHLLYNRQPLHPIAGVTSTRWDARSEQTTVMPAVDPPE